MSEHAHPLPDGEDRPEDQRSPDQPDWRVSADEGADAERHARPQAPRPDALRLTTSNDLSESIPVDRPVAPARPARTEKAERSTGPTPWTAAASSVPKLKIDAAPPPDPDADFATSPHPARPKATVTPMPERPARPADDEDARVPPAGLEAGLDDGDEEEDGFLSAGPKAVVALPVRKLDEPFWVVATDWLQTHPRVLVLIGVGLAAIVATWMFWPRSEKGISIHNLHAHAATYDGQTVRIDGRVGEVFNVGAGWAFNLHQGRDTIVVFTRGVAPRTRDKVSVVGSVSTGYLDGQPRQAILATP
jgi:hypothetical protein